MRIAIVGSGVSGLGATWLLKEYSGHEVNIYEKGDYPGGHTHTVKFGRLGKKSCDVDTDSSPNISASDSANEKAKGDKPKSTDEGFNPRLYRMVFDVLRFNVFAKDLLRAEETVGKMSIGEYLEREGYGDGFKEDYLLPMTAAIWSTAADQAALDFPALTLIRFFHNHHLLQLTGKPKWLTVQGGAKKYVDAILSKVPKENLHLNTEITAVRSLPNGVELTEAGGAKHIYDHVILATHSDTTLAMLRAGGEATMQEEKALGSWSWSKNEAVLHWDERLMPTRRRAYSAWNYLTSTSGASAPKQGAKSTSPSSSVDTVSLTYDMNILQHLPESKHGPVLVTLNPPFPPDPLKTLGRWTYTHPMMTAESVSSQPLLPSIQNRRHISYAGAWTKYGFHEDGFTSAMRLVTAPPFSVKPPFPFMPAHRAVEKKDMVEETLSAVLGSMQMVLLNAEPVWQGVAPGAGRERGGEAAGVLGGK
ncbi:hypothetical protein EHS25_002597 [Saitozyma podzolica]|uniref:Amine oxidase domain-containing protein n=1 Tax=Saitozyma podzolica TaxID=1890683 RepID=A0A427YCR7_9TREE|nr:hypothetical protein EHS25_002597 [Saitozyma podzolica]